MAALASSVPLYWTVGDSIARLLHSAVFDVAHLCREAVFDSVIDEVLRPSEKMPLRHLGTNQFAAHLFQLGEPCLSTLLTYKQNSITV